MPFGLGRSIVNRARLPVGNSVMRRSIGIARRAVPAVPADGLRHIVRGAIVFVFLALPLTAGTLRIATYDVELTRRGPGLLLQDIERGKDAQVAAVLAVIGRLDADVLVLTGFDWDHEAVALTAFADRLARAWHPYPHRFTRRPNTGWSTDLDLDGDGRTGGPGDAQGFGRFAGEGGIAVLSRLPLDEEGFQDYSKVLWRDLPGAILPPGMTEAAKATQRLATTAHWSLPVVTPEGPLTLLIWHASPPVFDGPEDRNGRRNHDEAAFWLRLLAGELPFEPPKAPFILIGNANLDPVEGDGLPDALEALLTHPALRDPAPRGAQALATADFTARNGPGRLRVDYVLPSSDLTLTEARVDWPPDGDPFAATLAAASRHRPVTVDLSLP